MPGQIMARLGPVLLAAASFAALTLPSWRAARAEPQGNAALTIGVAGRGYDREIWDETAFHLGLHGDLMFFREDTRDFGLGPYLELSTLAFDELQFGGGASLLLPVIEWAPVVLSGGAYARRGDDDFGFEPGVTGQVFWGSRSYNFHANYVMAAGLVGQLRMGLGDSRETSIVIAAHLDLAAMSLPFIFLVEAARGGSHDTDPVK
jgi:hypothetical protein